jgi:hypothetical protein
LSLDPNTNPAADPILVAHNRRLQANEDLGYAPLEDRVLLKDADLVPLDAEYRRVKNDGWKTTSTTLSNVHILESVDISNVWSADSTREMTSPEVTIELVYEATGKRVVQSDRHGGLTPERWLMNSMRETGKILLPNRSSMRPCGQHGNICIEPSSGLTYGALARFSSSCLTSRHNGARFQIKASTEFRMTQNGALVSLEGKSAPFVFVSNKRSKSALVGRKRKADEKK